MFQLDNYGNYHILPFRVSSICKNFLVIQIAFNDRTHLQSKCNFGTVNFLITKRISENF